MHLNIRMAVSEDGMMDEEGSWALIYGDMLARIYLGHF